MQEEKKSSEAEKETEEKRVEMERRKDKVEANQDQLEESVTGTQSDTPPPPLLLGMNLDGHFASRLSWPIDMPVPRSNLPGS